MRMTSEAGKLPRIEVLDEVASTNVWLMERGRAGAPHGSAVRARAQTAGRGRRDHRWISPEGGLYLSVLIRPRVASMQLPGLPVACALGIVDAQRGMGCSHAQLKWPNDVVVGTAKLAGILVELGQTDDGPFAVCGVGVNVNRPEKVPDVSSALQPTSLASCLGDDTALPTLDAMACQVRAGIMETVATWEHGLTGTGEAVAPLTGIVDAYNERLAFRGERVTIHAIDGPATGSGVLLGVDEWGRALVEDDTGYVLHLDASQASIRPLG